jgi:hypothetical protein
MIYVTYGTLTYALACRFLSVPKEVLTFPLSCLKTGSANTTSFACPPIEVELEVERGGVAHAVCYWYRLYMADPRSAIHTDTAIATACARAEGEQYGHTQPDLRSFRSTDFPFCFDTGPRGGDGLELGSGGTILGSVLGGDKQQGGTVLGGGLGDNIHPKGNARDTMESASTYGSTYSGLPSHYRQAATLMAENTPVCEGDCVVVEVGIDLSFGVLCRLL